MIEETLLSPEEQLQELSFKTNRSYPVKKSVSSAPTGSPKRFSDQFVFYKNGATYRLYVWIDGDWKYCALS